MWPVSQPHLIWEGGGPASPTPIPSLHGSKHIPGQSAAKLFPNWLAKDMAACVPGGSPWGVLCIDMGSHGHVHEFSLVSGVCGPSTPGLQDLTYLTISSGLLSMLLYLTFPKTGVSKPPSHLPQAHCSWFLGPCCDSPDPLPVSLHCAQS